MKLSSEFPGVYRVQKTTDALDVTWFEIQKLRLGAFRYKWVMVESWLDIPTPEMLAAAIERDQEAELSAAERAAFEPYFVLPEAAA